jgi:hypothetical protein
MPMPFRRRKSKEHVAVDAEAEAEAAAEREAELAAAARKEEARLINEAVTRRLSEMKQVDDEGSLPSPSEPGKQPTRTRRRSHDGTYGRTLGGDAMAWLEFRESSLGMSKKDIEKAKEGMKQKQEQLTQRELKSSESAAPAVASASSAVASAPSAVALAPSTVPLSPPADRPAAYPVCKTPKDAAKAKVSSRDRLAAMQKEADEKKAALGIVPVDSSTDEEKSASAKVAVGAAKAAAKVRRTSRAGDRAHSPGNHRTRAHTLARRRSRMHLRGAPSHATGVCAHAVRGWRLPHVFGERTAAREAARARTQGG